MFARPSYQQEKKKKKLIVFFFFVFFLSTFLNSYSVCASAWLRAHMCVLKMASFSNQTQRERRRKIERERERRTNWQTKKKHTSIHNSQTHSEKGRVGLGSLLSSLSFVFSIYLQTKDKRASSSSSSCGTMEPCHELESNKKKREPC